MELELNFEELSYQEVFVLISEQTDIVFMYNQDYLPKEEKLTHHFNKQSLASILDNILDNTDLVYKVFKNQVIIRKGNKLENKRRAFTVNGKVRDVETGEELIGVSIIIKDKEGELPFTGVTTNEFGFYSASLYEGEYELIFRFIGYTPIKRKVHLSQNSLLNIGLEVNEVHLQEVVVKPDDKSETANLEEIQMGLANLDTDIIRKAPAFLGESDVIRTLQLLPGVQSTTEGNSGFYVRGGGIDQNLVMIDGAPVYNMAHFIGLFSIFNPDAVKEVSLYKGGIPSKYGGRLSSVVDVQTKDGNSKKTTVIGGVGSIANRLTIEGPLGKNEKGTFVISGRRTYLDLLLNSFTFQSFTPIQLYFYDFNFKGTRRIGKNDKLTVSGYIGRDRIGIRNTIGSGWGNKAGVVRWTHTFGSKVFSNTSFTYSEFSSRTIINLSENVGFETEHSLRDFIFRSDISIFQSPKMEYNFGVEIINHKYNFGSVVPTDTVSIIDEGGIDPVWAIESNGYLSAKHELSKKLKVEYGLRFTRFDNIGPGNVYVYDTDEVVSPFSSKDNIVDTLSFAKNKIYNTYGGIEPRFSMRYMLNSQNAIKLAYNRTRQYVHRVSSIVGFTPIEMWAPVNKYIPPQYADQVSLGYYKNFRDNTFKLSVEGYYKVMRRQIDFKPTAELLFNDHLETEILSGRGKAYGLETMLRKDVGKTSMWLSYTLSRSERKIAGINKGKVYPASFDRRHDISLLLTHRPKKRVEFSANWVFASGVAYTFPVGKYEKEGFVIPYFVERNSFRLPSTHRLNLSITVDRKMNEHKKNQSSWNFSIYNVYARKNPYAYIFRQSEEVAHQGVVSKIYLLTIMPSFTYNFKF